VEQVALDANVVIGFLDPGDAHHEDAREAILGCGRAALSIAASAYADALVRPLARGCDAAVEAFVADLGVEVVALDRRLAREAAALRAAQPALGLPDAMVLAAARARDARLLTFDARLAELAEAGEPRSQG